MNEKRGKRRKNKIVNNSALHKKKDKQSLRKHFNTTNITNIDHLVFIHVGLLHSSGKFECFFYFTQELLLFIGKRID